jgi:hypothetical protein
MPPPSSRPRHPASAWLDAHWPSLPNDQWVAATATRLVAHHASLDEVLSEVRRQHLDPKDVAVVFVTSELVQ